MVGGLDRLNINKIIMTLKHRRCGNTAMPADTAMLMFLTNCDKNAQIEYG